MPGFGIHVCSWPEEAEDVAARRIKEASKKRLLGNIFPARESWYRRKCLSRVGLVLEEIITLLDHMYWFEICTILLSLSHLHRLTNNLEDLSKFGVLPIYALLGVFMGWIFSILSISG